MQLINLANQTENYNQHIDASSDSDEEADHQNNLIFSKNLVKNLIPEPNDVKLEHEYVEHKPSNIEILFKNEINDELRSDDERKKESYDGEKKTSDEKKSGDGLQENDDDADEDWQMFGKDWRDEKKIRLYNNVYIKKRIFDIACNGAKKATHLLRRLLGVFKPEALLSCTLTGTPRRAQGKERQSVQYFCLNIEGKTAIKKFVEQKCLQSKWVFPDDREIDLKREHAVNSKK